MADLNIRNFPPELLQACKVAAIEHGCTLREWVIAVMELVLKESATSTRRNTNGN